MISDSFRGWEVDMETPFEQFGEWSIGSSQWGRLPDGGAARRSSCPTSGPPNGRNARTGV
jgi:hypothetical protein